MKMIKSSNLKWCPFNPSHQQKDPDFKIILDYYLWTCPTPGTAYGAETFKDLGWKGGSLFKKLKNALLTVSSEKIPFISVKPIDLLETLKSHRQSDQYSCKETIILVNPDSEVAALFRSIRNAFAHGSFMIRKQKFLDDYFYFFENRDPNHNYEIRARIVVKSSTLKSWIKIVNNGPKAITQK